MSKPSWIKEEVFLTDKPHLPEHEVQESFVVYQSYSVNSQSWYVGWKNYSYLWSALRYGMYDGKSKTCVAYVKNSKTNEIVWRSWEDEHPYRDR